MIEPTNEHGYPPEGQIRPDFGYMNATRSITYGYLAALPLLIMYEVMIVAANDGANQQIRVGAEVWLKGIFESLGQTGVFILGLVVALVGLVIVIAERKKEVPIKTGYFAGIVVESFVYAIIVALAVSSAVGAIFYGLAANGFPGAAPLQSQSLFMNLALSIGAGVYEELLFRVILVGGAYWVLIRMGLPKVFTYFVVAIIGAAIFSGVHYVGSLGDDFTMPSFTFRFLFGLALNVIFLVRGFGVAAWTHAIYDVLVVTGSFGN